jgi:hypothetical protein
MTAIHDLWAQLKVAAEVHESAIHALATVVDASDKLMLFDLQGLTGATLADARALVADLRRAGVSAMHGHDLKVLAWGKAWERAEAARMYATMSFFNPPAPVPWRFR